METLPYTDCSAVHPPQPYPSSQPLTAKCSLEDPPANPATRPTDASCSRQKPCLEQGAGASGTQKAPLTLQGTLLEPSPSPSRPGAQAPGQDGPGLFCHTPTSGLWRVPGGSAFKTYPSSGPCSRRPLNAPPSCLPR